MRIVVDDIAASKTGALSVLRDFYNYILEHDKENEWIFVLGDKLLEEKDNIKVLVRDDVKASRKNRLIFDLKTGAGYFEELKPDVLFSMQNTLPKGYKGRQVLYVHQPLGYQKQKNFSFLKADERQYAIYQHLIGRIIDASVKRADKVIVQTGWMKDAVIEKTGISPDRVVKILPDIDVPERYINTAKNNDVINNNVIQFFYPSGEILYKNHSVILEAVSVLKDKGIKNFEVSFTLDRGDVPALLKYPDQDRVRYLGRISRDEVFDHYTKDILLFASYIETFGYPLAEARAVGGRIIASDCPFSHEILDGYERAVLFDPFDPAGLAKIMEEVITGRMLPVVSDDIHEDITTVKNSWGYVIKEIEKAWTT